VTTFYISCTTCKARLKVRDELAVGEIHTCPRCGSMVMITPPRPSHVTESTAGDSSHELLLPASVGGAAAPSLLDMNFDDAVEILTQESHPSSPSSRSPERHQQPPTASAISIETPRGIDQWADTVEEVASPTNDLQPRTAPSQVHQHETAGKDSAAPDTVHHELTTSPAQVTTDARTTAISAEVDAPVLPPLPDDMWVSHNLRAWRQFVLLGGAAVAGVALAIGVFGYAVLSANRGNSSAIADAATVATSTPPSPEDRQIHGEAGDQQESSDIEGSSGISNDDSAESLLATQPESATEVNQAAAAANSPQAANSNGSRIAKSSNHEDATPPPPLDVEALASIAETNSKATETPAASDDVLGRFGDFLGDATFDSGIVPNLPVESVTNGDSSENSSSEGASEPPSTEETSPPRQAPRQVDVAARLADPIAAIEFSNLPLVDFLDFISDLSTIPVTIEPEALAWRRLTPHAPISVKLKETTVGGAVSAALEPLALGFDVREGHLVVTAPAVKDATLRQIKHPVNDLVPGDSQQLVEFGRLITQLVAPESWKTAGGPGSVEPQDGGLLIEQSEAIHYRVIAFCETLRAARGLSLRTRFDASRFQPLIQRQLAQSKLNAPIQLNFRQSTDLTEILKRLGSAAGITILIDWRAATEAGWSTNAKGSVVAEHEPLGDVLSRLLSPMDLAYRVIDGATLEITTPEKLRVKIDTEFFPMPEPLSDDMSDNAILARIRQELGEHHFGDGQGALHLDHPSRCLIAALPQPQQNELAALIEEWRKK
jgi:DNA-directed RNA polymerase subunit RPC12/RpoP